MASLVVNNLAGALLLELQPPFPELQLVREEVLLDDAEFPEDGCEITCVKDETPMWTWDHARNPDKRQVEGNVIRSPNLRDDYVNVLTREPIRTGIHYFEFVMHFVGDEQWLVANRGSVLRWCGVTMSPEMAGSEFSGRSLRAWTYYCGRRGSSSASISDGRGALHANGKAVLEFDKACTPGNVINMLVDADKRIVGFALDGKLQGACQIPGEEPLYVMTHMDTPRDHVELKKPMLEDAPKDVLASLTGALIDIEKGEKLRYY
eukprot:Skav210662  [mRNA]  locus=scaffold697:46418:49632:+ [translate_table: standard]